MREGIANSQEVAEIASRKKVKRTYVKRIIEILELSQFGTDNTQTDESISLEIEEKEYE